MQRWSFGKEPIAMFEFTTWHASFPDFFISLRHYTVIGKQLFLSKVTETGFAEQFLASHRMGPALICLKISV
jgi:hypothetical protein